MIKRLVLALSLLLPCAAMGQTTSGPGFSPSGGTVTINLGNPSASNTPMLAYLSSGNGTGNPDSETYTTGGGSSPYNGDYYLRAGAHHFLGLDGTEQARVLTMQGAVDYTFLQGGQSGFGATRGCVSATDLNVNCVDYAQGTGSILLGNGSGLGFEVLDPGAAITSPLVVYGGTSTLYPELFSAANMQLAVGSSSGAYVSEGGVNVAGFGGGTTPASGSCYPIIGSNNTTSYAKIGTSTNCPLYINTSGTSTIYFANSGGIYASMSTSSANTTADYLSIRGASSTTPVLLQTSGISNVGLGGTAGSHAALALTATVGHIAIPVTAGKPTGVPVASASGNGFTVYDSTDNWLCIYVSSWKCSAAFPN